MNMFSFRSSSHRRCSVKKGVLKNFVLESLFNQVADLQSSNFVKKRLQHRCFPVKYAKFLRTSILKNICKRVLLQFLSRSSHYNTFFSVQAQTEMVEEWWSESFHCH